MTLTMLRDQLYSLAVFRDLYEEEVFQDLLRYLDSLDDPDTRNRIEAYTRFTASLYRAGGDLTEWLLRFLKTDENVVLKARLAGSEAADYLEESLQRELAILQSLSEIPPAGMIEPIGTRILLPAYGFSYQDIAARYEEMLASLTSEGYGIFREHTMFKVQDGALVPVTHPEYQTLDQLYGYQRERADVLRNTEALASGHNASNVLLYGDAGTGKSSTVKACAAAYSDKGVRLIEFNKDQVEEIPAIAESLRSSPLKFIFYIDDLSFGNNDDNFNALKGILEGNISGCSNNIVIYATSNRRHLVRESMEDRQGSDLHLNDTLQEIMSLSSRFGLTITFQKPAKELYLEIVDQLAKEYGLVYDDPEDLHRRAEAFAIRANGRSPRTAKQFVILASNGLR
ncbi:MAG: ATP-binding protein [Mogibacterium sp.]|nr:ATP-binding protein [Mogibacterium sp.]